MALGFDLDEEAVDCELFDPADAIWPCLVFPNDFEIKIGVSYLTREKLLEALVVIFVSQNKIIILLNIYIYELLKKNSLNFIKT